MILDFFENYFSKINLFDSIFLILMFYNIITCFLKGFSLSLISFMKWVLSLILTIILVPRLQPIVENYIESDFINNVGLGGFIFLILLFLIIIVGKAVSKAVTWTGLGSIDKSFGLIFGVFKGYVVSVCLFSILNWFYPYQNWDISLNKSMSFEYIKKGSEVLIEEFPQNKDLEDTKEKIEKI